LQSHESVYLIRKISYCTSSKNQTFVDFSVNYPIYLDCAATTPLEESVKEIILYYMTEEYGNEGSRTHEYGSRAKQAVQKARDQVADLVGATRDEIVFTSGATESNNLAILGLAEEGRKQGKQHIICTRIEHKAVLGPVEKLEKQDFEVTWVDVDASGRVDPFAIKRVLREDTLLVSLMHVNNETGVLQPIREVCEFLSDHPAYMHCDAAQGYGKELESLKDPRIDLISISGHKIYGPKGIGALVARRRGYRKCPLSPIFVGGGQERGLRPGTLPVPLVAALGEAAELAAKNATKRMKRCLEIRDAALRAFAPLNPKLTGDQNYVVPHILNLSINGIDSEALILSLKDLISISNGSACTSTSYSASHVLRAMGMSDDEANSCIRISWCHLTPDVEWKCIVQRIMGML
jgi:cysteine desulfurase